MADGGRRTADREKFLLHFSTAPIRESFEAMKQKKGNPMRFKAGTKRITI